MIFPAVFPTAQQVVATDGTQTQPRVSSRLLVHRRCQVGSIPAEERAKIKGIIDAGVKDKAGMSTDMFDVFQKVVFKEMFYNTFQRFIVSPEYAQMHADIKNAYNKVCWRVELWVCGLMAVC